MDFYIIREEFLNFKMIKKVLLMLLILMPFASAEFISPYPDQLDYRNFQGENWLTSVKSQDGCGSCWAFAAVGVLEGFINLYFNQQIDVDLSEQHLVSDCCVDCGSCQGGGQDRALDFVEENGIVSEDCFPYSAENSPCDLCDDWEEYLWKVNSETEEDLEFYPPQVKSLLLEHGPVPVGLSGWRHAVGLVGYNQYQNTWIIRNSWGEDWGENGYGHITFSYDGIDDENNIYYAAAILSKSYLGAVVEDPLEGQIECSDWDGDGYCYWGLTEEKPANCPSSCEGIFYKDEDDSNSEIDRIYDLWVSGYNVPNVLKFDSAYDLDVNVSFKGNLQNEFVEDVVFNVYYDDQLIYEQVIDSMVNGEEVTLNFVLDPAIIQENPYMYHSLRFVIATKDGEIWQDNNYLEKKVWIYTHDEGYQIWEEDYLFDCLTGENPEGQPIDAIIGNTSVMVGISSNKDGFYLKNCVLAGWRDADVEIHSSSFLVENNSFRGGHPYGRSLMIYSSENGLICNNTFLDNSLDSLSLSTASFVNITLNRFESFPGDGIHLSESNFNEISNNTFEGSTSNRKSVAIYIFESRDNVIRNNYINSSKYGIRQYNSDYNDISYNIIENPFYEGISLEEDSSFNEILYNTIKIPDGGILVLGGENNNISGNYVCQESYPLYYGSFGCNGEDSSFGTLNTFGFLDDGGGVYGVWPCDNGWPEHGYDFFACNDECVIPTENMEITEDMTFCPGTYSMPDGIIIESDNVEIDCDDTIFDGEGVRNNYGVEIQGVSDIVVRDCEFKDYDWGAYIYNSEDLELINNKFTNIPFGIEASNSENIDISDNIFSNNDNSINLYNNNGITLRDNRISSSDTDVNCIPSNQYINDFGGNMCQEENCDNFECHTKPGEELPDISMGELRKSPPSFWQRILIFLKLVDEDWEPSEG
jgi:parallel beta-helix repeat protein